MLNVLILYEVIKLYPKVLYPRVYLVIFIFCRTGKNKKVCPLCSKKSYEWTHLNLLY